MTSLSQSQAIPIKIQNNYSYSMSQKEPVKYLFELRVGLRTGDYLSFRKIENNRYTSLITPDDNIKYEDIISYSINISLIPDEENTIFFSSGIVKNFMPFFSSQDNNVYIEFNKLANGKATCISRYIDYNNLNLSISPPF